MIIKELHLVSPIPPSVNHAYGYRAVFDKKKHKWTVVKYLTTEAKEYKNYFSKYAQSQVNKQGWDIEQTRNRHHIVECIYYFPRIDMDDNNYPKCMADALNEIAYIDDNFVIFRTIKVLYDSKNPRVELKIYPTEYIGIFDNEEHMNQFESNCQSCKRYSKNCSILKKAKEGRIQEEIVNGICSEYKTKKGSAK